MMSDGKSINVKKMQIEIQSFVWLRNYPSNIASKITQQKEG